MTSAEFLGDYPTRVRAYLHRAENAVKGLDATAINARPAGAVLSIGQILEHLALGAEGYVSPMNHALVKAKKSTADKALHFTFFGKLIIKAAGPDGKGPMPKKLVPGPGPYGPEVLDRFKNAFEDIIAIAEGCKGMDLGSATIRNPIVSFITMNLADCFAIQEAHAKRHVAQIEAQVKAATARPS
ncbi:MAG: DinB family protein [Fimbriimonas ginsengisoli]|uniref:DinB family protein n=1 Tax=Fimbriimonas ginsengisoli TaxID=1005039 RepID=A0A931PVH3_FIMGI|nr:DinB family protein [Fimbriimonas ginsengisoli]